MVVYGGVLLFPRTCRAHTHTHTHTYTESRFKDAYVEEGYKVIPMVGSRGGGFIFDTNMLHKVGPILGPI